MATALLDNWTEMNCIQLIREFRARPLLWDQKDPFYYKKTMKPQLWEEIGEKLDVPALECKHKMNVLMSSFRREKAKILHKLEDSNGESSDKCMSTWFAFKEMMFLMDKDTERKRREKGTSIDDENEDTDESTSSLRRTLLKHHLQPPISNNKRKRLSGVPKEVSRKSLSDATTSIRQPSQLQLPQVPQATNVTETDDEIKSFVNFLSFKMKKYSETTKNAVQQAICDVIFKADQNYYENNDKFIIVDETDPFGKNVDEGKIGKKIKEEYDVECYIDEDDDEDIDISE